MWVVLDTNILVSATVWKGSVAYKLVSLLIEKEVPIVSSEDILMEYARVVHSHFHFQPEEIEQWIDFFRSFMNIILPTTRHHLVRDDPDDNKIVDCALACHAGYIVSYDKDLLRLKKVHTTLIITPEGLLRVLQQ